MLKALKKAYAQGVKIALGTDGGTPFNYHNNTAYEFELMEKYGVDRMDILKNCDTQFSRLLRGFR